MSRSFRVYQKKRGDRRTGSGTLAKWGETLFFALFFLGGCGGLVAILATFTIPEWQVNNEFVETTCTVQSKRLVETTDADGTAWRPEFSIDYLVKGEKRYAETYDIAKRLSHDRRTQQDVLDAFEVGKQYPCWYDPRDPQIVVLTCGYSRLTWLWLIIPISFILIGAGGVLYRVWHWGKSDEHRAAAGPSPIKLRTAATDENGQVKFPMVPPPSDMANSPGTTLRLRLPISGSATVGLIVLLVVCLFWNTVMVFLMLDVVRRFMAGEPNWIETIVVAPLAVVGIFWIYYFFRRLLITTGIGPTLVEISDHPLHAKGKYEVFLSQSGRLRMRSIELALVATEEVRYRQGTDTRTETRCVHRISLFKQKKFEIHRNTPLEVRCDLNIPDGIMHSFKSKNNAIAWSFVVEGKAVGWPDYRRTFPVVIYPGEPGDEPS